MFKNHFICFIIFLCLPQLAVSASQDGIPFSFIFFQAFNFAIFLGILIYFVIKKSPQVLQKKYQEYASMNEQAEKLYKEAMDENHKIRNQIQQMNVRFTTFEKELNEEIVKMKEALSKETEETCSAILRTANYFVEQESMKMKEILTKDLLKQVTILCKKQCQKKSFGTDLFIQKVARAIGNS